MDGVVIDTPVLAGFVAAIVRVAAFVVATPLLSRRVPVAARTALVLAIALAIAQPVERALGVTTLIEVAAVNLAIGFILGFITGLLFQVFIVAGGLIDSATGLGVGALFDPVSGAQVSVFSRFFDLVAITIFVLIGGARLLLAGLNQSVEAVALDGSLTLGAPFADLAVELIAGFMLAGLEIAFPALAALFLTEVAMGVGARMVPQANVFLLGLPVKLLVAIVTVGVVMLAMPGAVGATVDGMERAFVSLFTGFAA